MEPRRSLYSQQQEQQNRALQTQLIDTYNDVGKLSYARQLSQCSRDGWRCNHAWCPFCSAKRAYRKSMYVAAALNGLKTQFPRSRLVMCTISGADVPVSQLSNQITSLTSTWNQFTKLSFMASSLAWSRTLEAPLSKLPSYIDGGLDDALHPHLHALVVLPGKTAAPTADEARRRLPACR